MEAVFFAFWTILSSVETIRYKRFFKLILCFLILKYYSKNVLSKLVFEKVID